MTETGGLVLLEFESSSQPDVGVTGIGLGDTASDPRNTQPEIFGRNRRDQCPKKFKNQTEAKAQPLWKTITTKTPNSSNFEI